MAQMRLSVFAYHIQSIMVDPPPTKMKLHPCDGVIAEVTIEKAKNLEGSIWDQVTINGKACGNRCGGAQEFTKMVIAAKPEILLD